MLKGKTVAVVVPAYNEEKQIADVIKTMPSFVDRIVVVDDHSTDKTALVVKNLISQYPCRDCFTKKPKTKITANKYNRADLIADRMKNDEVKLYTPFKIVNHNSGKNRLILITHQKNSGPGAAIATGYFWCREQEYDCVAVMDGDGQMDPNELESICLPVINNEVDYVKGNRLTHRSALFVVPKIRYFGNSILSLLTKVASGYWHISDSQCGYTAISLNALKSIRLYKIYKQYGCPNSILVKLNIAFCTVKEVQIKPIYDIGEKSKMKIPLVMVRLSWLLFKSFFTRLYTKYFFRDFHPLFLLYNLSFLLILLAFPIAIHLYDVFFISNRLPVQSLIIFTFLTITAFQTLFFAMWMDMQDNQRLQKI
jgi:glycosyltransferase involved in cell wall biosynthesis